MQALAKHSLCSLCWCWWLVLEWYERKILLAGWWLMLELCEKKILLAGWRNQPANRVNCCWI